MNIVYYCSLIRLISFLLNCIYTWCKETFEDNRGRKKKLETYVIWGVVLYSAQLPFFRSVSWKRGADEPESK